MEFYCYSNLSFIDYDFRKDACKRIVVLVWQAYCIYGMKSK